MNSGKSTLMRNWFKMYWVSKRVLYLAMRITYTNNLVANMIKEGLNFESYKNIQGKISPLEHPYLVCQVDSLEWIEDIFLYDVVIFDEWVSILTHISPKGSDDTMGTYNRKIKKILDILE